MLTRRALLGVATMAMLVTNALVAAQGAAAHGAEHHAAPAANAGATGGGAPAAAATPAAGAAAPTAGANANGGMPPVVGSGAGGAAVQPTAPANDANAPAPGAQPAAPGNAAVPAVDADAVADPVDVAADAAGVQPGDAVEEIQVGVDEELAAPVEADSAPPRTVDGGGTHGGHANHAPSNGGGAAVAPTADPVAPSGTLPFTGLAESLLVVALAGMFVPIGVLLYCGARSGEQRARQRLLAMPRFQWADSRHPLGR